MIGLEKQNLKMEYLMHSLIFDKLLKDPENETIMKDEYDCGDGIHPGLEGCKKMVEGIDDLTLFTKK